MFAKFRPPLIKKVEPPTAICDTGEDGVEPLAKRRKISSHDPMQPGSVGPQVVFKKPGISTLPRKPLLGVPNPAAIVQANQSVDCGIEGYYNVLWRKYSTKKHKTWDGDGVLRVNGGYAYLQDVSGREMGKVSCNEPLLPGSTFSVGGKEIEVDSILSKKDFQAGRPFLNKDSYAVASPMISGPLEQRDAISKKVLSRTPLSPNVTLPRIHASFKTPLLKNTVLPKKECKLPIPRHEPSAEGALVMKRPKSVPRGKQIVDVVVDPLLTKTLREHQREGVKFLYECVMGMREFDGRGAILADEMGLGKTLQTIALIWTLLKQTPIEGDSPVIRKALIVCPVTLINNWRKEFRKWLGPDRLGLYVYDDSKKRVNDFTKGRAYNVMIVGYEKLRTISEDLKKGHGIDIVIADEGHRLKTAKNKSALAIRSLDTPRRVILSGTPIQNDMSEFFMMVDFVNPDLLGSFKTFTKEFETPIVKSRQPAASRKDIEIGEGRGRQLSEITSMFILRRTADILAKYLPAKTEYVLMCRPTQAQTLTYKHVLASPAFQSALGNSEASLQLITILKKVCNSPWLLNPKRSTDDITPQSAMSTDLISSIPAPLIRNNQGSTKLRALDQLLYQLRASTSEKVVLISNYTSTLAILELLLTTLGYPYLRLDGSTPSTRRQGLVDEFNRAPASQCFAFLLSAKAGGVGLNLIGASRLVLFDVDWNPATDIQAMARIHRDGQKRPCFIYRFLMAGGLDEKIWQRQVTKLGLASNIMDQKGGASSFTRDELKDLFRLDEGISCQTHDLLGCKCGGRGLPNVEDGIHPEQLESGNEGVEEELPDLAVLIQAKKLDVEEQERKIKERRIDRRRSTKNDGGKIASLMAYSHISTAEFRARTGEDTDVLIGDDVLLNVLKGQEDDTGISFVFAKTSS